jgi:chemotaxis signal transduction protein
MNSNVLPVPVEMANDSREVLGEETPHLVFDVNGQPYACPIGKIQQLMRCVDASLRQSPPGAPSWEAGRVATGKEGEGIPVVSLRALWNLPRLTEAASRERQAILIVDLAGKTYALLVDACRCVLSRLPQGFARFLLSPALQSTHGRAFKLATPWEQSLLVVLNLDALLDNAAPASQDVLAAA